MNPEQILSAVTQPDLAADFWIFTATVLLLIRSVLRIGRRRTKVLPPPVSKAPAQRAPLESPKVETAVEPKIETPAVPSLEPAPPEISVQSGLTKSRNHFFSRLVGIFSKQVDDKTLTELEELLISSDVGVSMSAKLVAALKEGDFENPEAVLAALKENVRTILQNQTSPEIASTPVDGRPRVIVIVGVNGVGKTTTIGKLSEQLKRRGAKVLVGACDTFRAAAVDQMKVWADRVGVDIEEGEPEAKPSTVAYKTIHRALQGGYDVVLVDTAGRLHTKVNLMNELQAVTQIIARELPGAPHETLLVVDASTGQNALQQAREFHAKSALSGVVVTKLDGTPKGGIVIAIRSELGLPIRYIGVGEGVHDLKPFSADEFVEALFARGEAVAEEEPLSARGQVRRRRREAVNAE